MAKGANVGPAVLVLAGMGAGLLWLSKGGSLKNLFNQGPAASAELKLRLLGFHAETDGTLSADIEALNPSSIAFQVQSIVGNFIVNGKVVGTVKMFGDQVIRPNDQGKIPVSVRPLPALANMFRQRGMKVQFDGKINLNNNVLPLQMNYVL